ncbi:ead/Ea22-like family protein [Advenella mimigardefordensis]|uniref:Ead/Ea22-like family protein n=1 Tax=Advenella mimigardefordensis (strain DSM 17166 / LMG 22922 / DPN7) TaxID=1247726 RepID=W0PDN3_ADVMD|nr:ead/Ea22-like family protein [Advenella mimigardefordensis]AHG63148.1 hypothetical protein MIM_c10500 [Advenella mimigardefordensis DPN7]
MTPEKLDALYALAKKATPGPWEAFNDTVLVEDETAENEIAYFCGYEYNEDTVQVDAAYVAAASPDVITALIDRVRELEAERTELRKALSLAACELDVLGRELEQVHDEVPHIVGCLPAPDVLPAVRAALNKEPT